MQNQTGKTHHGQDLIDCIYNHINNGHIDLSDNIHHDQDEDLCNEHCVVALIDQGKIYKGVYNRSFDYNHQTPLDYLPDDERQHITSNNRVLFIVCQSMITIVVGNDNQELGIYLITYNQPLDQIQFEWF